MILKTKNKTACLLAGMMLTVGFDASAVPFFAKHGRNSLAQSQADSGGSPQNALMTGYTQDVQGGLSDFQFLARNFSGANPRPISTSGVIVGALGTAAPAPADPTQTPLPGSLGLLALGASLLFWRRRK